MLLNIKLNLIIIFCSVLFLVSGALCQSDLCSWVQTISRWSNGQRNHLQISIDQHYTTWNISFKFDADVTFEVKCFLSKFNQKFNLMSRCQAWKGDVEKVSDSEYFLKNKCFNGVLYPCQCLELGYLIRYLAYASLRSIA